MRYRKLRIAWSVFWGVVAVLLIVLWVRSYRWYDTFGFTSKCELVSVKGKVVISFAEFSYARLGFSASRFNFNSMYSYDDDWNHKWNLRFAYGSKIRFANAGPHTGQTFSYIALKHYALLAIASFLSAAPWLRWQFSLRTMLIATTLVAVVLGSIVWLNK